MKLEVIQCELIPRPLEVGKLYVSKQYKVAIHICPCGCGQESVTPFQTDGKNWDYSEDERGVSLSPSILNPCGTHYWIKNSEIFD